MGKGEGPRCARGLVSERDLGATKTHSYPRAEQREHEAARMSAQARYRRMSKQSRPING